jgi:methionine biosynthesis protein MetW
MINGRIPKIGERVEVASRYVNKCNRLLDVGCGEGVIAPFLKEKALKIYGIDKSRDALKKAKENGLRVKWVDLDKTKIPFKNHFFDTVTCLDVIEHVKEPADLIKEIHRALKKHGRFILSSPNIRFSDHLFRLVIKGFFPITSGDKTGYDGGHIHYFTFSDLKRILKNSGFEIIHEEGIINKGRRGIKGRIAENIFGKVFMREFRSPGILIIAEKV